VQLRGRLLSEALNASISLSLLLRAVDDTPSGDVSTAPEFKEPLVSVRQLLSWNKEPPDVELTFENQSRQSSAIDCVHFCSRFGDYRAAAWSKAELSRAYAARETQCAD